MREYDPCDCYTDSRTCGECITKQTPIDERPRCKEGHVCQMLPSHRWMCSECKPFGAYAVGVLG